MDHFTGASSQRCHAHRFTAVSPPPPPLALSPVLRVKQLHIRITFQRSTSLSGLFCCQTLTTAAGALALEQRFRAANAWITCRAGKAQCVSLNIWENGAGEFLKSHQMLISERYPRCIPTCSFTVHGAAAVPER